MKNVSLCEDRCLHVAKEGDREGYGERLREREGKRKRGEEKERGREREGKRERDCEWERYTQFGEKSINGPSNRGRVGLTLNLDELLKPLRSYFFKRNICVYIILAFI